MSNVQWEKDDENYLYGSIVIGSEMVIGDICIYILGMCSFSIVMAIELA